MSTLDEEIQGAVDRKNREIEKARAKFLRNVRRILGKNILDQLGVKLNEYEGELEFTVKGKKFALTPYANWFYVEVRPQQGRFGDRELCTTADDMLLFIAQRTRKVQTEA